MRVFINYALPDAAIAGALVESLEPAGAQNSWASRTVSSALVAMTVTSPRRRRLLV